MGLSFGEIVVLAVLAIVVVGPKDLPKILRSAGRIIGQLKRTVADVRRETGLEDILRGDFRDLERLADHIEGAAPYRGEGERILEPRLDWIELREREYPSLSADGAGLIPEDSAVYPELLTPDRATDGPSVVAAPELPSEPAMTAEAATLAVAKRPLVEGVIPREDGVAHTSPPQSPASPQSPAGLL